MRRAAIAAVAVLAMGLAGTDGAEERGGTRLRNNPAAMLDQIDANRGCPLSTTNVAVGVNRAFSAGSSATQQVGSVSGGSGGCRPLVTTQVAAGVNLSLGRGSQAAQAIGVQGQRGALATTTFSRGANMAVGARSNATQQILNQVR
jgi:hypothetical protein